MPPALSQIALLSRRQAEHTKTSKWIENTRLQEYASLFNERPRGLREISAWLLSLEKTRGKECYESFSCWYKFRLYHPPRETSGMDFLSTLTQSSRRCNLEDLADMVTHESHAEFNIGSYNSHFLRLVLNGSALDPPTVNINTFRLLGVQSAHLDMFAGLRVKEQSEDDLCVLTLGKFFAFAMKLSQIG